MRSPAWGSWEPGLKTGLALAIDLLAGEPPDDFHPVCWMGKAVNLAESAADTLAQSPGSRRLAGIATALALPAGVFFTARGLLRVTPPMLRGGVEVVMLYSALAARSLDEAAREVDAGLEAGIEEGRRRVSRIVGRDTDSLDEAGVVRAAVESVAENTNDGVLAPMFYGFIGGAPLALSYKMVNTLDSMIGHRNERYQDFGWASARLDDLAGFIPARLTALAAVAASAMAGGSSREAMATWKRDARGHRSPNAGVCESTFAGALGISLGGPSAYGGAAVETPVMGAGLRAPGRSDINRAIGLMYGTTAVAAMAGAAARWAAGRLLARRQTHGQSGYWRR